MVSERDRIIKVTSFLNSLGIDVVIAKNKARGNKGFFKTLYGKPVIHIAKGLDDEDTLSVLIHEFAHYLHYTYDKTLKTLDFIFDEYNDVIEEELILLTVNQVSSDDAKLLFSQKACIKEQIKEIAKSIKQNYPDFLLSKPYMDFEKVAKKSILKYFLKYDRVKILEMFSVKLYSVDNIDKDFNNIDKDIRSYIKIKSLQRKLKRINSKISRQNRYYNSQTEMFARSLQTYFCNYQKCSMIAPNVTNTYDNVLMSKKIKLLNDLQSVFSQII